MSRGPNARSGGVNVASPVVASADVGGKQSLLFGRWILSLINALVISLFVLWTMEIPQTFEARKRHRSLCPMSRCLVTTIPATCPGEKLVPYLRDLQVLANTGPNKGGEEKGGGAGYDEHARLGEEERTRVETERQLLITMLLAHFCAEHDATPWTFVDQVLRLYENNLLDSVQFLFDLGLVSADSIPYHHKPMDRSEVVAAIRRGMEVTGVASSSELLSLRAKKGGAGESNGFGGGDGGGLRMLSTSRYRRDFTDEKLIARGAFGDVYSTCHRLDGTRYAIKKVEFTGMGIGSPRTQAVMREVQCLAQLDHPNIVRYHTSWLESAWLEEGMGKGSAGNSTGGGGGDHGAHVGIASIRAPDDAPRVALYSGQGTPGLKTGALVPAYTQVEDGGGRHVGSTQPAPPRRLGMPWGRGSGRLKAARNGVQAWGRAGLNAHLAVEETESDMSDWSQVSDSMEGVRGVGGGPGGDGDLRGGAGTHGGQWWRPPGHQRDLSIDLDDVVSFGAGSSEAGSSHQGSVAGNSGWDSGSESERMGGLEGGGVKFSGGPKGGQGKACGAGAGAGVGWREGLPPLTSLLQYTVTLYIQMILCPGDTLKDWFRKRNAQISAALRERKAERRAQSLPSPGQQHGSGSGGSGSGSGSSSGSSLKQTHGFPPAPTRAATDLRVGSYSGSSDLLHLSGILDGGSKEGLGGGGMATAECFPRSPAVSTSSAELELPSPMTSLPFSLPIASAVPPPHRVGRGSGGVALGAVAVAAAAAASGSERAAEGDECLVDLEDAVGKFHQLVEGIAHIHSKGIMHRDLKPENIFMMDDTGLLKIGDFGLSTMTEAGRAEDDADVAAQAEAEDPLPTSPASPTSSGGSRDSGDHTTGVGTASYAAPEQLEGRRYGLEADMFSLGLVLLELCCPFHTGHERSDAFKALRAGSAPQGLAERDPALAALAERLCHVNPLERPTAEEALAELDAREACSGGAGVGGGPGGGEGMVAGLGGGEWGGAHQLKEELEARKRQIEEKDEIIVALRRHISEISRNTSPAFGPVTPTDELLDSDFLALGLSDL
ncbi:unnamed protein product, partial [Discosporangium mesarthrocarpum]